MKNLTKKDMKRFRKNYNDIIKTVIALCIILFLAIVMMFIYPIVNERMQNKSNQVKSEIEVVKEERETLKKVIDSKIEQGTAKYVLTLKIKQNHISFDFSDHLKDANNALTLQIPVDKEYYDSLEVGDVISNKFRVGSFVFKGSVGYWYVKVIDKEIQ